MKLKKKQILSISITLLFVGALFLPEYADALGLDALRKGIGALIWRVSFIALRIFLYALQFVGTLFEAIAGVQNFFSDGVNAAWEATRDFANLFFALMLLFIAIATVLGMNEYSAKNMLPKFFMAAILINFSKAIVGFFIDISQIIMFEFYNALGGNITNNAINNSQLMYFNNGVNEISNVSWEAYVNGTILNVIMILLITIMIFAFLWGTLTLAVRLVTLWVLISLAPLAFVSAIVPPLKSSYGKWVSTLQEQLVKGPAFMFFIWLAFIILNATTDTLYTPTANLSGTVDSEFSSFFTDGGPFIGFTLTAIFLFMANNIAQQAAEKAPGFAKGAVNKLGGVATLGVAGYMGLSSVKGPGQALSTAADSAKSVGKAGLTTANMATLGTAGAAYSMAKNSPVGYGIRRDYENFVADTKKGKSALSLFSKEAKEYQYGEWKKEQDKMYAERDLTTGTGEYDKKAWSKFKRAEAAASSELKDVNDNDLLISEMGQASDIATRRAALKKLAGNKDGMSQENLDKMAKELGVTFEPGSDRTSKIEQIAKAMDFKNANYAEQNNEHRQDIANALAKEGDYTYNPGELAKGSGGQDSVVAYLKNKDAKKKIGAMNGKNFTSTDAQGNTVFNQQRFDEFISTMSENELKNDRLYENLPQRKDWEKWMKQSYPDPQNASPNVQVFYNQVVNGSSSGAKRATPKANASQGQSGGGQQSSNTSQSPSSSSQSSTTTVGQTSTGGLDVEKLNDN